MSSRVRLQASLSRLLRSWGVVGRHCPQQDSDLQNAAILYGQPIMSHILLKDFCRFIKLRIYAI